MLRFLFQAEVQTGKVVLQISKEGTGNYETKSYIRVHNISNLPVQTTDIDWRSRNLRHLDPDISEAEFEGLRMSPIVKITMVRQVFMLPACTNSTLINVYTSTFAIKKF